MVQWQQPDKASPSPTHRRHGRRRRCQHNRLNDSSSKCYSAIEREARELEQRGNCGRLFASLPPGLCDAQIDRYIGYDQSDSVLHRVELHRGLTVSPPYLSQWLCLTLQSLSAAPPHARFS